MKRLITLFLLAFFLLVITSQGASSIELRKEHSIANMRDSNLRVSLRLIGGKGAVVRQGRSIGFTIQVNEDAYVVVYNIDSDGYIHLLFPYDGRLKRLEGRRIYYLPERGSDFEWVASGNTGVEYIHAIAVKDKDRIKEEELYYLEKNETLPEDKRFRVDSDPFTAFNMIDEELVIDAEDIAPATDYTYFYINRRVDYPRYLCYRCHGEDKVRDPYRDECPEVTIDRISYDEEPSYPYPPLFEISHVDKKDYYETDRYSEKWLDDEEYGGNDTNVYLSIFYTDYDYPYRFYWPSFRTYIVGTAYPLWWDDFWWDFGWSIGWSDYYYFYWPFYTWWTPYDYYWAYGYRHGWWRCYYCEPCYAYRPIYGTRRIAKRTIDYRKTYTSLHRNKVLASSRLVKTKRATFASRYEKSSLKRKIQRSSEYSRSRFVSQKRRLDRATVRGRKTVYTPVGYRKSSSIRAKTSRKARRAKDARVPSVMRNLESRRNLKSNSTWRTKSFDKNRKRTIKSNSEKRRSADKPSRINKSGQRRSSPIRKEKSTSTRKRATSTKKRSSSKAPRFRSSSRRGGIYSPPRARPSNTFRQTRSYSRPSTPTRTTRSSSARKR